MRLRLERLESLPEDALAVLAGVEFAADVNPFGGAFGFEAELIKGDVAGCVFDAWEYVAALVREAVNRIILIDNYCDERTLMLLSKRQKDVECTIFTRFNEAFDADLEKHNRQYPAINKVQLPQKEHDRFLMIDDTVYILGDSLKNLGHSMTTVLKTSFTVEEILGRLLG